MKDIDFLRKNLIALTLVAGVALAGCAEGDEGMGEEGFGDDGLGSGAQVEPGQVEPGQQPEPGMERQEMAQGMAAPFSELDVNTDDQVTQQEFQSYAQQQGLFQRWDEDRDGLIGEEEFGSIGFDQEVGGFDAWDEDGNGSLNSDEFWGSLFGAYDENEDGHWDSGDWDDAGDAGFWDM